MKTFPANITAANQTQAAEPLVVLKINNTYYAERQLYLESIGEIKGYVKNFGSITNQARISGTGTYSAMDISLFDNGDLKPLIDTGSPVRMEAIVYLCHPTIDDLTEILKGVISNPIWTEGERVLSFTVETETFGRPVGFAPEEDEFEGFNNDVAGQVWPLCFGTVLKVPAVKAKSTTKTIPLTKDWNNGSNAIVGMPKATNGDFLFALNTEMTVFIGGIKCTGQFQSIGGTIVFVPSTRNDPHETDITLATRPTGDTDFSNQSVLWISDNENDVSLVGKYCIINSSSGWVVNYCISQVGRKCFFRQPWVVAINGGTIAETAPVVRSSWAATYNKTTDDTSNRLYTKPLPSKWNIKETYSGNLAVPDRYTVFAGSDFTVENSNTSGVWICNLIPSISILEVYAWRTYGDERIFVPVPSSRYTKGLNYSIAGKNCTAIIFPVPLSNWEAEQWEDQIYVSMRSTVGPNSCAIIKWIVTNYTDMTVDATTYAECATSVQDFWACFALTDKPDALDLIEQIAYQSRIGLVISNNTVKFKFLADKPAASFTATESKILSESLALGFTPYDDKATKFITEWKEDYTDRDDVTHKLTYGVSDEEETNLDCFIYNVGFFAKTFQDFWAYRKSNIWKILTFSTFVEAMHLETFDGVDNTIALLSNTTIMGIITRNSHNPVDDIVEIEMELACKQGSQTEDAAYWPGNPTVPANLDPGLGRYEIDYVPPVHQDSDGQEQDPEENRWAVIIDEAPTEVIRAENFTLKAHIEEKATRLLSTSSRGAFLDLTVDEGGNDVLNTIRGLFVGGRFEITTLQIDGDSGIKNGRIKISAGKCDPATTPTFPIKDTQTTGLVWTLPASIKRGEAFTAQLSGGAPGLVLTISLQSTDNRDYAIFHASDERIVSITLNGSGAYSASWRIEGGLGNDRGTFLAVDGNGVYEDTYSDEFDITSTSGNITGEKKVKEKIYFEGEGGASQYELKVFPDAVANSGDPFGMIVSLQDQFNNPVTDFNDIITLYAIDQYGTFMPFVSVGYEGFIDAVNPITNKPCAYIQATAGEWQYSNVELDWTDYVDGDITILAITAYNNVTITGLEILEVGFAYFGVYVNVTTAQRSTNFDLTVQAFNRDGTMDTSYAPSNSLEVAFSSTDGADILSITDIGTSGWSNGRKTVTAFVNAGSAEATATITVSESIGVRTGQVTFGVSDAGVIYPTLFRVIFPHHIGYVYQSLPGCDSSYTNIVSPWQSDLAFDDIVYGENILPGILYTYLGVANATQRVTLSYSGGYWYIQIAVKRPNVGTVGTQTVAYLRYRLNTSNPNVPPLELPYYDYSYATGCILSSYTTGGTALVIPIG